MSLRSTRLAGFDDDFAALPVVTVTAFLPHVSPDHRTPNPIPYALPCFR
jgi:hypothetical protein